MRQWSLYIVRCADATLYTGIALDVEDRVRKHNLGQGAKYTRGRGPIELVYTEQVGSRSAASRREAEIKRLPAARKRALVRNGAV